MWKWPIILCSGLHVHEQLREEFMQHMTDSQKAWFPEEFSHISWSSCSSPWVWQRSPGCCPWVFWQWMHNFWWDPKTVKEQLINSGNTCWEFSQLKMTLKVHGRTNFKTCGLIMQVYKFFSLQSLQSLDFAYLSPVCQQSMASVSRTGSKQQEGVVCLKAGSTEWDWCYCHQRQTFLTT